MRKPLAPNMNKKKVYIIAGIVLVFYGASYCCLRATHTIHHSSNEHHWVPEKRSPGHKISVAHLKGPFDEVASVVFWPLMTAEKIAREVF